MFDMYLLDKNREMPIGARPFASCEDFADAYFIEDALVRCYDDFGSRFKFIYKSI